MVPSGRNGPFGRDGSSGDGWSVPRRMCLPGGMVPPGTDGPFRDGWSVPGRMVPTGTDGPYREGWCLPGGMVSFGPGDQFLLAGREKRLRLRLCEREALHTAIVRPFTAATIPQA